MTLSFYVHKEGKAIITGLSTDTKPVSPVTGLIFIEEDTSKLFRAEAGTWVEKLNSAYSLPISQYTNASLANGATWEITHSADSSFERMIQLWRDPIYTDISLDFDSADEANYYQEDSSKTQFTGEVVKLEGVGLVPYAHWMLNESSGTNVLDSSGNGRDGTTYNSPLWVVGKLNNCLSFDGVNQYVNCGNIANFERTQSFSLECWFKTSSGGATLIMLDRFYMPTIIGYQLYMNAGQIYFILISSGGGSACQIKTNSTFNNNVFHHVITTYNGSSTAAGIKIYVDGVLQATTTVNDNLSATILNSADFLIARRSDGYGFPGLLDEIAIYESVLTQTNVTFRYNSGTGREDMGGFDTTKGWYIRTNSNQINTSLWTKINGITITETTPASTQIRYLISVDGRVTWKAWNGSAWVTVTLANIDTSGNSKTELEALTEANFDLLFIAGTFDIVSSLKTTDVSATPELSQITISYILPGKHKCKDTEITISAYDSTITKIENISGAALKNLRAQILI